MAVNPYEASPQSAEAPRPPITLVGPLRMVLLILAVIAALPFLTFQTGTHLDHAGYDYWFCAVGLDSSPWLWLNFAYTQDGSLDAWEYQFYWISWSALFGLIAIVAFLLFCWLRKFQQPLTKSANE